MSINIMEQTTIIGAEDKISALPLEFRHALKFAAAHDLIVILGYVEDEERVYLATIPEDIDVEDGV